MDENISEMLKSVMSDPDTMSKLMSVAKSLSGDATPTAPASSAPTAKAPPAAEAAAKPSILTKGNEERIALISAIRPYLSSERQKSADSMIKMLKMMKLTDLSKMLGNL